MLLPTLPVESGSDKGPELCCARVVETERREKAKALSTIHFIFTEGGTAAISATLFTSAVAKEISWIRELCEAAAAPGVGSALCGVKDGVQQALVENNLGELTVVNDTVAVHICFSDHFVDFLVLRDVHA